MAELLVRFPHTLETGERVFAGDVVEIPDELLEKALRPDIKTGVVLYAENVNGRVAAPLPEPEKALEPTEPLAPVEAPVEPEAEESKPKAKKAK